MGSVLLSITTPQSEATAADVLVRWQAFVVGKTGCA